MKGVEPDCGDCGSAGCRSDACRRHAAVQRETGPLRERILQLERALAALPSDAEVEALLALERGTRGGHRGWRGCVASHVELGCLSCAPIGAAIAVLDRIREGR